MRAVLYWYAFIDCVHIGPNIGGMSLRYLHLICINEESAEYPSCDSLYDSIASLASLQSSGIVSTNLRYSAMLMVCIVEGGRLWLSGMRPLSGHSSLRLLIGSSSCFIALEIAS